MKLPIQITIRNVSAPEALQEDIFERAASLEQYSDHIMGCRVTVDVPHRHRRRGSPYIVLIDLTVPGTELVVKHQHHEDLSVALREAFDAARRQLEDYERRVRGKVKQHEEMPHGIVTKIFSKEGYGFIDGPDGYEVYFHRNSVLNHAFDRITVGTEVRFAEEQGEKGPQASTVAIVGERHGEGSMNHSK